MEKNKLSPPKLAQRLLHTFLRDDLAEEVMGDLDEQFKEELDNKGSIKARWNYWYQVLNYVRPFAIKRTSSYNTNPVIMFPNYFKIALRNLVKQKLYSFINIGGLAVGLTCFILILLYVQHEFSYDKFYQNEDRIYRIYQRQVGNVYKGSDYFGVTPVLLASVMEDEFPEVEKATSVAEQTELLSFNDKNFWESGLVADSHFFDVFHLEFVAGDPKTALNNPTDIILIKSMAKKIFGDQNPIGQILKYGNESICTVSGVVSDPPLNSSLQFSFITHVLSNKWFKEELNRTSWSNNSIYTFLLLQEGGDLKHIESGFPGLLKKYRDPVDYKDYPFTDEYIVQPISSMHLTTGVNEDIGLKGNKEYIYLFSAVAIIVLLLACVNYMNLAIARSIKRAKEVGLRKVVGAMESQVIGQFLGESVFISLLSLLIAIGLTVLLLPVFSNLVDRKIELDFLGNSWLLPVLFLLIILVGLFSGSYPAFVMSSLQPVNVLKGKIVDRFSGFRLQRILIIVQYAVSIIMVIGSLVIYMQIEFMQQMELGYTKENVLTISIRDGELSNKYETLKTDWSQQPGISEITISSHLPINVSSSHMINDEDGSGPEDDIAIYECRGDADFIKTFGIRLVAGRNFSGDVEINKDNYLINETAAKTLGWTPAEAIGKTISDGGNKTVIGVVNDFHMHSLHLLIEPLIIRNQTTKEIGIRKVLGASVKSISMLLTKDFVLLVALAFVVAVPVSWYVVQQWLQRFAYRINVEWTLFAIAGLLALLIAYLTIGYQSIKAGIIKSGG